MSTIEEIIEAFRDLSPTERDDVWRRLKSLFRPDDHARHAQHSQEKKLPFDNWPNTHLKRVRVRSSPVHVKGKPVSETVIEDRR